MAYDERLADRVRDVIFIRPDVTEKRMFGGVGWMIGGNWAVGVMRNDSLVVRVEPEESAELLRLPGVSEFGRPGRKPMTGFVIVDPGDLSDAELEDWVERGADRASSMPPK